jgi:hypothetical protein
MDVVLILEEFYDLRVILPLTVLSGHLVCHEAVQVVLKVCANPIVGKDRVGQVLMLLGVFQHPDSAVEQCVL